jgi:signal transduction histidine kinase
MVSMPPKTVKKLTPSANRHLSLPKILAAARQEATGSKTSSYLITTATTGFVFALISLIIIIIFPAPYFAPAFILLAFSFALIFSPTRYAMEELIRELFPETDYDSHALVKRLNTISYGSLTLEMLSTTFFNELSAGFNTPESAFLFIKNSEDIIIKTSERFQNVASITPHEIKTLVNVAKGNPQLAKHLKSDAGNHILDIYHIRLLVPLTNNNLLVGLLLLGSKDPLKPYTTKDQKVLEAIAPKIGFAIKNAFAYEKIAAKNTKLISDLEKSNETLRLANRQLRKDDKLKDEFLFISTHELKNPITVMKGYISLIKEGVYGQIPLTLRPPIEQIDASNEQLITLLNNLLQIARYEAQRLEVKTQAVTICDVIDKVMVDVKPLSDQKHLQIVHNCKNPAIKVIANQDRLKEIMSNLLGNAIKYSDQGVITISHDIVQDTLVTHIHDEGVGIAPADQTKIFTRFFRVEEEAARGIPGSGLGLFIVKKMLEKMSGTIWFTSTPGVGSTFNFSLPLAHTRITKP